MDDDDFCVCCDLPIASCGKAAERRARAEQATERARVLALPGVFESEYPGRCGGCGESFGVGTPIRRGDLTWTAACCL